MRFPGFIGPSYQLRSANVECQRCINMYPEVDEAKTEKDEGVMALIGTPGLSLLATIGAGPIRGSYVATNGTLYVMSGANLYSVSSLWAPTLIGTINSQSGPVSMKDNTIDLCLVDGTDGWFSTLGSTTLTQTTDPNWLGSNQVDVANGKFVFAKPNSNQFYISNLLSRTINPIGFSSNNDLDKIVSFIWDHRILWLFGSRSSEAWFDSGAGIGGTTGNPFQIIQGGLMQAGCAATFATAQIANTVFWLGQDPNGYGMVYMTNGYSPQRISTHAVEFAIQGYGDLSTATSWCYEENGHSFYCLNFASANTTWVFDTATQLWHERIYTSLGQFQRHRASCHAFAFNTHVVGDYQNGNIYQLSSSVFTDNGNYITKRRVTPHISDDMMKVFYSEFQLDFEPGVGIDGSGQGINPTVILEFSDDGGHTWSNEMWTSLGAIGRTKHRAIWRRLGSARDRVFRVTISDPVKTIMIGAELKLVPGVS